MSHRDISYTKSRFGATARLVQYEQFESSIRKIQDGNIPELTASERNAVSSS